jgi:hypothetical protein
MAVDSCFNTEDPYLMFRKRAVILFRYIFNGKVSARNFDSFLSLERTNLFYLLFFTKGLWKDMRCINSSRVRNLV